MDFKMNSVPVVVLVALVHYTAWWSQKGALTDALFSKRQAAFLQIQLPTFNVRSGDHLFECWTLHASLTPAPSRALFQSPTARLLQMLPGPLLFAEAEVPILVKGFTEIWGSHLQQNKVFRIGMSFSNFIFYSRNLALNPLVPVSFTSMQAYQCYLAHPTQPPPGSPHTPFHCWWSGLPLCHASCLD